MRKLIVCNIISLDGYYEGPGGDVMALPFDEGFDDYNAERLRAADTLLLGRKSYEGFKSYWPPIADDRDAPPVAREISRLNNEHRQGGRLGYPDAGPDGAVAQHPHRQPPRGPRADH